MVTDFEGEMEKWSPWGVHGDRNQKKNEKVVTIERSW
jgi:hypothetical protein